MRTGRLRVEWTHNERCQAGGIGKGPEDTAESRKLDWQRCECNCPSIQEMKLLLAHSESQWNSRVKTQSEERRIDPKAEKPPFGM
jgi:hypothetical protein